ncbi:MAG: helix-turn-helix domain-containing protein [Propionibacteriaceae bacterium]|nr:helix-turn-helix domain-containing protein [Propionibacteriaceae bacterium]
MAAKVEHSVFDGTTGRSDHGGRRTHIIQILRDTREPLTVDQIAERVGIHVNTARFHLESLVDAGLATREAQSRATPGRPKVGYLGTLPNQTHERAQGYRLLAEILTTAIAQSGAESGEWMYRVGAEWGRYLTTRLAPFEEIDESEIAGRLVDKLDALWFAPELQADDPTRLVLHNCPFMQAARRFPGIVCQLHAGMINGSLEEMRSGQRLTKICPQVADHYCEGHLGPVDEHLEQVPIEAPWLNAEDGSAA